MTGNNDFFKNDFEVRLIKNKVLERELVSQRKELSLLSHILLAILSSLMVYAAFDAQSLGLGNSIAIISLILCPSFLAYIFLYADKIPKYISVILPTLLFAVRLCFEKNLSFIGILISILSLCLPIFCGIAIFICVKKEYTKNSIFAAISVIYAIILLLQMGLLFYSQNGTLSFGEIARTIDSFFDTVAKTSVEAFGKQMSLSQMQSLFGYASDVTEQTVLKDLKASFDMIFTSLKTILPSLFAIACMVYSFLTVAVFSLAAKILKINVFVCIMDEWWTYRPSNITIRFYDIMFFVFIISMFIKLPASISAAILNMFIILTPIIFMCAVRLIRQFFSAKTKNTFFGFVITALILILAFSIFSGLTFFVIGSIGTALLLARDRSEKLIMPIKLLQQKDILEKDSMEE